IFSSHGVTTLDSPRGFWARARARLGLSWRYADVAHARLASLRGLELHERQRYLADVRRQFGIEARFTRYAYPAQQPAAPAHIEALFGRAPQPPDTGETVPFVKALALASPVSLVHEIKDWLDLHGYYFLSPTQNSQIALALFAGGFASLFFLEA